MYFWICVPLTVMTYKCLVSNLIYSLLSYFCLRPVSKNRGNIKPVLFSSVIYKHIPLTSWTNSMEQSPFFEAKRSSAIQEIPSILHNWKVQYRIHNSSPPVPIVSQSNSVHASAFYFLKIQFNIILFSTPMSSKWSLSIRCPYQNPVYTSTVAHTCHLAGPSRASWFDRPNNIWWAV